MSNNIQKNTLGQKRRGAKQRALRWVWDKYMLPFASFMKAEQKQRSNLHTLYLTHTHTYIHKHTFFHPEQQQH